MSDNNRGLEHTLMGTDDAMVWAEEFCRIFTGKMIMSFKGTPDEGDNVLSSHWVDEGTMVAWFANAMQVAVNHYERRKLHEKGELTETEQFLKTWDEEHPDSEDDLEDAVSLEEQFLEGFNEGRPPT